MPRSRNSDRKLSPLQATILSLIYSVFVWSVNRVNEERALKLGQTLVRFLHSAFTARRKRNYQIFFGSVDPARDQKIDEEFLSYMSNISTEMARDTNISFEKLLSRVDIRGQEHIDEALKRGKGVILLGGHLGNFYTYHEVLSLKGYRLTNISFEVPIPSMERHINRLRDRFKITSVFVEKNAARTAVKVFRENGIFSIMFDVLVRADKAVSVPFGAGYLRMDPGPAMLASRFDVPILPVVIHSKIPYQHSIEIQPPLPSPEGQTDQDRAMNMLKLWRDWLEREVTKRPDQWWYWSFLDLHDEPQPKSIK